MPLKDQTQPITGDEWLYRRVHKDRFRTAKTPFVSPGAFEPRINGEYPDTDGISLFRAACLDSPKDILANISDSEKRKANGVVKLQVCELQNLGLSVVSTPNSDIPGHVSVPELSANTYVNNNQCCKDFMYKLAELVSPEERIVLKPVPINPR